jgi:hypothetical protein
MSFIRRTFLCWFHWSNLFLNFIPGFDQSENVSAKLIVCWSYFTIVADMEERKSRKRAREYVTPQGDILEITPLGAGNEVGRSCIILKFKGKTLMVRSLASIVTLRVISFKPLFHTA